MSVVASLNLQEEASSTKEASLPEKDAFQSIDYPEGGLKAWLTVAGATIVVFASYGTIQSFGVYQDYYTRVMLAEYSPSQISWIGSVQSFIVFAVGLVSGKLFDDGYFYHLTLSGGLLSTLCLCILSLAKPRQYWQVFLSQGVGMGLGMGVMLTPALAVTSHFFQKRRAVANGIVLTGSSIGGVVCPIMLNHLFPRVGFAWANRVVAFMILGLLCVASLIMRTRLPPASGRLKSKAVKLEIRHILTDLGYWTSVAGNFLVCLGLYFPVFYIQLFAVLHGVNSKLAFYSIAIINAASSFGRIIPNILADVYGLFNVIIPITSISGIVVCTMLWAGSTSKMITFAILYGFFSGAYLGLVIPLIASHARSIDEVGIRVGINQFAVSFAMLTGSPILGTLLNAPKYTWSYPAVFSSVVMVLGAVLFIFSRLIISKHKGLWRL